MLRPEDYKFVLSAHCTFYEGEFPLREIDSWTYPIMREDGQTGELFEKDPDFDEDQVEIEQPAPQCR